MKYPSVRVYGPSGGSNSFRAITLGALGALKELGIQHSLCATDAQMDEGWGDDGGRGYDVGLYFGNPSFWHFIKAHTTHKRRFLMVAPNGYGVPSWVINAAEGYQCEVLVPSPWAAEVVRPLTPQPVSIFPHGASTTPPSESDVRIAQQKWAAIHRGGKVAFLHTTSTASERKGTGLLLDVWKREKCHEWAHLTVHAPPETAIAFPTTLPPGVSVSTAKVPAGGWSDFIRTFHVVVQPSAAEGFGLVPLEAMCAGIPVLTPDKTGEGAYIGPISQACGDNMMPCPFVRLQTTPTPVPVSGEEYDGNTVVAASLANALAFTRVSFSKPSTSVFHLGQAAVAAAPLVHQHWCWRSVTERWLASLEMP